MKILRVISEHKQKKSRGQVEAIVEEEIKAPGGRTFKRMVTRHIRRPAEGKVESTSTEVPLTEN